MNPQQPLYEDPRLVDEYLLFHYGHPQQILPWDFGPHHALNFPQRIVSFFSSSSEPLRGLDLGCAVGRSTMEMSQFCHHTLGIDYSSAFIQAAQTMQSQQSMTITPLIEGHQRTKLTLSVPDGVNLHKITFQQGDAMNIPCSLGQFDRVLAANLLCRLPDPQAFLQRLKNLVSPHGELLLTTPATWLEEFTPRSKWPPTLTHDWVKSLLQSEFTLLEEHEEPFLIRETARKFQWTVAHLTKWKRKA